MNSTQKNQYLPDYLVSPGEILDDYLDSFGMTQIMLAIRTGLTVKTVNEIIKGKSPISHETALKFERVLGRPAHFWNNLELQFREDTARLAEQQRLKEHLDWLNKAPVNAMTKWGWISKHKDKIAQLDAILRFFGVASPEQWKMVWQRQCVTYRQTKRFKVYEESLSAWLRQGEIQAQQIPCDPFDEKRFQETLKETRVLTKQKDPQSFAPVLVKCWASAGVAVVFVPELPHTGVSGATRWLADKAIIQLSLRYKSDDHFWFTFFHEAGHILKHGRKSIFIESLDMDEEKEREADAFARDKLIPPSALRKFVAGGRPTLAAIEQFAEELGIAPGIVVGRLQHDGVLFNDTGNKLKVFYRWVHDISKSPPSA